jgi:hypothetical protein
MRTQLLGVLLLCLQSCAATPTPKQSQAPSTASRLIEGLASSFPPKFPDLYWGGGQDVLPTSPAEDRSRERDKLRVLQNFERLRYMGIAAFDDLVAASDDPRHSFSAEYAALLNHSVGDACFMIIESQVDFARPIDKSRIDKNGWSVSYLFDVRRIEGLQSWWAPRRKRSLQQLQIESLVWTIAKEEEIGFADDAERFKVLGPLVTRLDQLKKTPDVTSN